MYCGHLNTNFVKTQLKSEIFKKIQIHNQIPILDMSMNLYLTSNLTKLILWWNTLKTFQIHVF